MIGFRIAAYLLFGCMMISMSLGFLHCSFPAKLRPPSSVLYGSLHQQVIELPHCDNPSQYEFELQKVIPQNKIIRWYIIEMTPQKVKVEVVIENKGVGNSL